MLPIKKKMWLVAIAVLCCMLVGLAANWLLVQWPQFAKIAYALDLALYDTFFTPQRTIYADLRLIDLNESSESKRSRADIAKMIRLLNEAEAKCIALDIIFAGNKEPLQDNELVHAVSEAKQTVLAMNFYTDQLLDDLTEVTLDSLALPDDICLKLVPQLVVNQGVDLPFAKLLTAASYLGHVNNFSNGNHHFPPVLYYQKDGNCYAALPVAIATCYFSAQEAVRGFEILAIPRDGDGQMLVNFVEESEFQPCIDTWEAAMTLAQSRPEYFRDKVVLIINRSTEEDRVPTPLGSYPKWAVLASLTNQLLLGQHIETSAVFYQISLSVIYTATSLILYFLAIAPLLKKPWRKIRYVFVLGSALFLAAIFLWMHLFRVWMGVAIPLLTYNASMAVVRWQYYRKLNPLRYLIFDLAILERKGDRYPIKVSYSPAGSEEIDLYLLASKLEEGKFMEAMAKLRAYSGNPAGIREEHLKIIGSTLFQGMFHHDSLELLRLSLERAKEERSNLRVIMQIDPPELSCLPWELMHSPKPPRLNLALDERLSLVRFTPLKRSQPKLAYNSPLKVLVAIASPIDHGLKPLDVETEKNMIAKVLQPLTLDPLSRYVPFLGDIRVRFCEHATLDKLRTNLEKDNELNQSSDIDVLHYIGHSRFDPATKTSYLELETEAGGRDSVSAEALGDVLNNSPVKLVVLNSCEAAVASSYDNFSGLAQTLVSVGVPGVIAMQFPIRDDTAIEFSRTFYSVLIKKFSVEAALAKARKHISTRVRDDKLGWATPVLFMRSKDGIIFPSSD